MERGGGAQVSRRELPQRAILCCTIRRPIVFAARRDPIYLPRPRRRRDRVPQPKCRELMAQ
eukprot:1417283-Lingulodinium_polyedra.AAC.1